MRRFLFVLATAAVGTGLVAASPALAAKPHAVSAASCTVSGDTVNATGLPTELVNFLVTDASGTHGWVLGFTDDGTWSVAVPAATSPTTYQFVSKTWGPNGSKYVVFAAC